MTKLLEIEKLSISFSQYFKGLEQRELKVLSDLTMDVDDHEISSISFPLYRMLPATFAFDGNMPRIACASKLFPEPLDPRTANIS